MDLNRPRILRIRPNDAAQNVARAVESAVAALKRGALAVIPTDTVYGLAADPAVPGAEARLQAAKERDRDKPIALLAASLADVRAYGAVLGDIERRLADKFWPGALTLVVWVDRVGSDGQGRPAACEGFRVPDDAVAVMILKAAGGVLRVTSANMSGQPPALTARSAWKALPSFVEVVVDAGRVRGGMASTVVKVQDGCIRLLREGAVPRREILEAGGAAEWRSPQEGGQ